jgi:hypothetical protein
MTPVPTRVDHEAVVWHTVQVHRNEHCRHLLIFEGFDPLEDDFDVLEEVSSTGHGDILDVALTPTGSLGSSI